MTETCTSLKGNKGFRAWVLAAITLVTKLLKRGLRSPSLSTYFNYGLIFQNLSSKISDILTALNPKP